MSKWVRRILVAGNWKMNGLQVTVADMAAIDGFAASAACDVAVCPPATMIADCRSAMPRVAIGGQDCHAQRHGAFTGWIAADMLKAAGATMVIVGHSERRAFAGESDADVKGKAEAALASGLRPIICVGESEAQREKGEHIPVVLGQLAGSLPDHVDDNVVIAYEPIWAIGTGKTATVDDVMEMHGAIRDWLRSRCDSAEGRASDGVSTGDRITLLYGGSVNPANAAGLFAIGDVDGALVGGASLKADTFLPIIDAASRAGQLRINSSRTGSAD